MKKLMAILAAAMLVALAFPLIASAEKVEMEGRGALAAKGTGRAEIEGKLNFRGTARQGNLVVEDRAGDAVVHVAGYGKRIDEGNGRVRYVGFRGRAHIQGSDVAIDLAGKDIKFVVWGSGSATLKGKGTYRTFHGTGNWSPQGTSVEFDEEAPALDAGQ